MNLRLKRCKGLDAMTRVVGCIPLLAACAGLVSAWEPGTSEPAATSGFVVDTADRRDVLAFHNTVHEASEGYESRVEWTGDLTTGVAGTTSAEFKDDVLRRIHYFRALAGLPTDITFNPSLSAKCQKAALMFSANNDIDHYPGTSWTFYSADGALAASKSNLSLGNFGPQAVTDQITDDGVDNQIVGHRRWLLYPLAREMGTGDVPPTATRFSSNAVWVIGNFKSSAPARFVAWPNAGYVPRTVVPARWSLSYPDADFSSAVVTMSRAGVSVPLTVVSRTDDGYGDNTLVWEPSGASFGSENDVVYQVEVSGIGGAGVPSSTSYQVIPFDPAELGESITISGPEGAAAGAAFTFNPIEQADLYQLRVSKASASAWTEGAEDSPAPEVIEGVSGGYVLRQSDVVRSGSRAFHLTIPSVSDNLQVFEIDREILPSATSQVLFHDLFRFATVNTRLALEVSTNDGLSWTEIWGRAGNGITSSTGWDTGFNARVADLSGYAGRPVRIRFALRFHSSAFVGTSTSLGVFIDDISVTGAKRLVGNVTTDLPAAAAGFTLSEAVLGGVPLIGETYHMRVRPKVGTRWFADGPLKSVTGTVPSANASLKALDLGSAALLPAFSAAVTSYRAEVGNGTATLRVKASAAHSAAVIKVNGSVVASGAWSQSIPLAVGINTVKVAVTAQDGVTRKTHVIEVTRKPSAVRSLVSLASSAGSLSPAFSPGRTDYVLDVRHKVDAIRFTPVTKDAASRVKVNGAAVKSGNRSDAIPLPVGRTIVKIVVTAQNGETRTYQIRVRRAAS